MAVVLGKLLSKLVVLVWKHWRDALVPLHGCADGFVSLGLCCEADSTPHACWCVSCLCACCAVVDMLWNFETYFDHITFTRLVKLAPLGCHLTSGSKFIKDEFFHIGETCPFL